MVESLAGAGRTSDALVGRLLAEAVPQKAVSPATSRTQMDNRFMVGAAFWRKKQLKNLRFNNKKRETV